MSNLGASIDGGENISAVLLTDEQALSAGLTPAVTKGPKGDKGDKGNPGDVSSVCGVRPNQQGDVVITAADVGASNPNLLDNWDFRNPVNQRGQTVYAPGTTAGAYCIDRWRISRSSSVLEIVSGGCAFGKTGSGNAQLAQNAGPIPAGTILTLSAIIDGVLYTVTTNDTWTYTGVATTLVQRNIGGAISAIQIVATAENTINVWFYCASASSVGTALISAAKLEYGPVSTLANDPPMDYAVELVKCQHYYQLYDSQASRPSDVRVCRPPMRVTPTQGTVTIGGTTYYYNDAEL